MLHLIYIGVNSQAIDHFSQLSKGEMKVVGNYDEAAKWFSQSHDRLPVIILFEKGSLKKNLADISYLHKKFFRTYIVLITDSLTKEESFLYLKSGICNTMLPNENENNYEQTLDFIIKRQSQFHSALKNKLLIKGFHLPLWKRIFDILFSSLALLCLSPIFLLVAIAIRIESEGPIVYKSKRVGSNYRVFDFLKFRSMYTNADKRLKEFNALNQYKNDPTVTDDNVINPDSQKESPASESEVFLVSDDYFISEQTYINQKSIEKKNSFVKLENDPRITKVGHFIRKYSIDELPQLINILKGDMSVVGNRPLPLYEAELLTSDEYIDRFMAPAGLTGLWQVEKRGKAGNLSAEERKLLDIKYAQNYSFGVDLSIIFRTFTAFVQKEDV